MLTDADSDFIIAVQTWNLTSLAVFMIFPVVDVLANSGIHGKSRTVL